MRRDDMLEWKLEDAGFVRAVQDTVFEYEHETDVTSLLDEDAKRVIFGSDRRISGVLR